MTKELKIFCKNTNEYVAITGGESLNDIFQRIKGKIHIVPICARVNNKTEDLGSLTESSIKKCEN
ncbi:MAG: hypothetical protein RSA66_04605 [Muribaculaceae bacterium]